MRGLLSLLPTCAFLLTSGHLFFLPSSSYWNNGLPTAAWITIFWAIIMIVSIFGTLGFAEEECVLAFSSRLPGRRLTFPHQT